MGTDSAEKLVEIGVVGRPHGIDGGVRVFLHNPDSAIILDIPTLYLMLSNKLSEVVLLSLRRGNRCHSARFKGITSRNAAERLKGAKILVSRSMLPPPDDDEFYVADLIGLEAFCEETPTGRIVSSRPQGDIEVVRVEAETEEFEVPLVDDFVVELDIAGGRVVFKDIEELPRTPLRKRFKK